MAGSDCAVCKLIRTYLLFAVPLLALVGVNTKDGNSGAQLWFARAELIDVLAWGACGYNAVPSLRGVLSSGASHGQAAKNQISVRF